MKVSILQENLNRALDCAILAANSKSRLPVLANVLIATEGGRVKIAATNLETLLTCYIGAKVEVEGAVTIQAKTLRDYVATLPPERVDLSLDAKIQTLTLHCGRTDTRFKGIDAMEFPMLPLAIPGGVSCDGDALLSALRACTKIKPSKNSYDWQESAKIELGTGALTLTALSQYAKARQVVSTWGESEIRTGYLPRHTLDVLAKVIAIANKGRGKHNRATVEIGTNDKGMAFTVDHITVYAEWQEVEFPTLTETAPANTFGIDARELSKSLGVLKSFDSVVTISVNGHLDLSTQGESGSAGAQLGEKEGYTHAGEDFEFTSSVSAVLAAIGATKDAIEIGYLDPEHSVTVTAGESVSMFAIFTAKAVKTRKRHQHRAKNIARRENRRTTIKALREELPPSVDSSDDSIRTYEAVKAAIEEPLADQVAKARAACVAALARYNAEEPIKG